MARRVAIAMFVGSAVAELVVALGVFFEPQSAAAAFHIASSEDTMRLAFFTGWLLVFLAVACGVAAYQLLTGGEHRVLTAGLGATFAAMGISLFFRFGEPQYLLMDTVRGIAMLALTLPRRAR